ncbi:hypothetical protein FRB99_008418 [Tulasnella sp. 403]|nr:hypothetical protein FRB99_008418 [Tulasnella sp. 403]
MNRYPPRGDDMYERRLRRRSGSARPFSTGEASVVSHSQYTHYTNETATQDIHTMLALSDFPAPPTTIPSPSSPNSMPSTYVTRYIVPGTHSGSGSNHSHATFSTNQEEILQDHFIAGLLQTAHASTSGESDSQPSPWVEDGFNYADLQRSPTSVPGSSRQAAADQRLRYVPSSPTLSAHTHRASSQPPPLTLPPSGPTPPLPPLPSPLLQAYPPLVSSSTQQPPESESSHSKYSMSTHPSTSGKSHGTAIIRVSSPPAGPPRPAPTTVVGYARAAYIPKSAAISTPAPIIVPSIYSPTNLIDLSSPGPRSPEPAVISPRDAGFPLSDYQAVDTLSPLPGRSRFRPNPPPTPISPRDEAPPNVPEDVTNDDAGPSTSYFVPNKYRNRFSMSSLFSKFSRSTSISSKHRFAWSRAKRDLPPLPKRAEDIAREQEKRERDMPLPALVSRAGFLSQLLESGRLPSRGSLSTRHDVEGTANPDVTPPLPSSSSRSRPTSASVVPTESPPDSSPWEYSSGQGYVDENAVRNRTSQSIRSFFTRGTTTDRSGHFNVLEEEMQRRYQEELAGSSASRYHTSSGHAMESVSISAASPSARFPSSHGESEKSRRVTIVDQPPPPRRTSRWNAPWTWRRRTQFAVVFNVALLFAVIGTVVGLTWNHGSSGSSTSGPTTPQYNCPGNYTGSQCNLDATCVCTSSGAVCNPLAVAVRDIIQQTNSLINTAYTPASVALTMWDIQGSPVGGNCLQQAILLDVNPVNADDKHAKWTKSAVLWAVLQSQDLNAALQLRQYVNKLNFASGSNPPGTSGLKPFQIESSGLILDFQQMTIVAPPVTWRGDASPSDAQISSMTSALETVLDRFYTSASALSTQAQTALRNYWTKDLNMDAGLLATFVAAFQSAPILLPFDMTLNANRQSLATVMQLKDPKTISFPPPQGCNPMLSSSQLQGVNAIEQGVFGISPVSSVPPSFDLSCFGQRPVYGVLDVLRLRLPFVDGQKNASLQAAVLTSDVASRLLIRSGAVLSGYPSLSAADVPQSALVQANYGTLQHLNHVLLAYLKSLSLAQATTLATFICGVAAKSIPPTAAQFNASTVLLTSLPVMEVALMGAVGPSDIDHSVSSFATPSGGLFFGSETGDIFRQWAANTATSASGVSVTWADSASAAKIVNEPRQSDGVFDQVWDGAQTMISNANTVGTTTGPSDVQTIVDVFQRIGYLS